MKLADGVEWADQSGEPLAWFGESLRDDESVNLIWVGIHPAGEMRMVDIVCDDATHRLLCRVWLPEDGGETDQWEGLTFDALEGADQRRSGEGHEGGVLVERFSSPSAALAWMRTLRSMAETAPAGDRGADTPSRPRAKRAETWD